MCIRDSISPFDICFNPLAASFIDSPKIVRTLLTKGEVKRKIDETVDNAYMNDIFEKMMYNRSYATGNDVDVHKSGGS